MNVDSAAQTTSIAAANSKANWTVSRVLSERNGRTVGFYEMPYEGHYIWGATAGMVINLYRRLTADAPPGG